MRKIYKVAEHFFSVELPDESSIWVRSRESYGPFEVGEYSVDEDLVFALSLSEDVEEPESSYLKYTNRDTVEPGFITLSVYRCPGAHVFEFTQPGSSRLNGRLRVSEDFSEAVLALDGPEAFRRMTFNTAVDFCSLLSTASRDTLLTHASAVVYEGRAWLFLGRSGTGKSTHSRMWLNALDNVVLMNDDHPVIRLDADGRAIAYGSPWSGKTPCYKNMSAPVGGVIRISRADHNRARRLSPVEAYASLMTSCSGMTWERELADGRDRTLQGIVSKVPCWVMECLPDEDAARVCCEAVTAPYGEDR